MSETESNIEKLSPSQTEATVVSKRKKRAPKKGKAAVEKKAHALERLKVEYVPINSINPNDYNPNRQSEHDFELLLKSIEEDGFTQPIVVSSDGVIVDGEHRWRGARALGYEEIPVVRVAMDAAQARIATIRHNRARGSHDIELEAEILRDLQKLGALDWAADSLMINDEELNRLLEDVAAPEALAGDEFGEAWVPEVGSSADDSALTSGLHVQEKDGGTRITSASPEAIEAQRDLEKRLAAARTEEERDAAKRDAAVVRVNCIFTGEEGAMVKKVLGQRPAEKLLDLCRKAAS